MLPWVFSFIAGISTEPAHEEDSSQCVIFCHCLLAFIHFMDIASYNEWGLLAAHLIHHWKLQPDVFLKNNLKNYVCLQLLIHHCPKLLARCIVFAAVSRQRQAFFLFMMTNTNHVQDNCHGKFTFRYKWLPSTPSHVSWGYILYPLMYPEWFIKTWKMWH